MAARQRMLILFGFALFVCGLIAIVRLLDSAMPPEQLIIVKPSAEEDPAALPPVIDPEIPLVTPRDATPSPEQTLTPQVTLQPGGLIIPVAGVTTDQLVDSFDDPRSEERKHEAIDILAPLGTPVLAAADGEVIRLFLSEAGGNTIYQLGVDRKTVYYYAHLDRYEEGITEGQFVKQGQIIGYVGDTGNAEPGNYHLHFSISIVSDPQRWWEGVYVNPYPLLTSK